MLSRLKKTYLLSLLISFAVSSSIPAYGLFNNQHKQILSYRPLRSTMFLTMGTIGVSTLLLYLYVYSYYLHPTLNQQPATQPIINPENKQPENKNSLTEQTTPQNIPDNYLPQKDIPLDNPISPLDDEELEDFIEEKDYTNNGFSDSFPNNELEDCIKKEDYSDESENSFSDNESFTQDFETQFPTFWEWKKVCDNLPINTENYPRPLPLDELIIIFQNMIMSTQESFSIDQRWLSNTIPQFINEYIYGNEDDDDIMYPFVEKRVVPENTQVFFHADYHADIRSLNSVLAKLAAMGKLDPNNPFIIKDHNFYLVFFGDYVDRGMYGLEVLYTLCRLKLANPNNVILLRGNHEDLIMNEAYGLEEEIKAKYPSDVTTIKNNLHNLYNLFPSALYLGCGTSERKDFILCCHGGPDLGYCPDTLLNDPRPKVYEEITTLNRWQTLQKIFPENKNLYPDPSAEPKLLFETLENCSYFNPNQIGFLWNDFMFSQNDNLYQNQGRGIEINKRLAQKLLSNTPKQNHVYSVVRGHQQTPETMPSILLHHGIYQLLSQNQWSGNPDEPLILDPYGIITLNLPPCSIYGQLYKFNLDTFAILTLTQQFATWKLQPYTYNPLENQQQQSQPQEIKKQSLQLNI